MTNDNKSKAQDLARDMQKRLADAFNGGVRVFDWEVWGNYPQPVAIAVEAIAEGARSSDIAYIGACYSLARATLYQAMGEDSEVSYNIHLFDTSCNMAKKGKKKP